MTDWFKSSFTETTVSPPQLGRKRSATEAANGSHHSNHFGPGKSIRDLRDPTTRKLTFSFRKKGKTEEGKFCFFQHLFQRLFICRSNPICATPTRWSSSTTATTFVTTTRAYCWATIATTTAATSVWFVSLTTRSRSSWADTALGAMLPPRPTSLQTPYRCRARFSSLHWTCASASVSSII